MPTITDDITIPRTDAGRVYMALRHEAERWRKEAKSRTLSGERFATERTRCRERAHALENLAIDIQQQLRN